MNSILYKSYDFLGKGISRRYVWATGEIIQETVHKYKIRNLDRSEVVWRLKDNVLKGGILNESI